MTVAAESEYFGVPFSLRNRVAQLRKRARGNVLHLSPEMNLLEEALSAPTKFDLKFDVAADAALDAASDVVFDSAFDSVCSVGALAASQDLESLLERIRQLLSADGKLYFIEPEIISRPQNTKNSSDKNSLPQDSLPLFVPLPQANPSLAVLPKARFRHPKLTANADITLRMWESGFSVLEVERLKVPETSPVKSIFFKMKPKSWWHRCVVGVAHAPAKSPQTS